MPAATLRSSSPGRAPVPTTSETLPFSAEASALSLLVKCESKSTNKISLPFCRFRTVAGTRPEARRVLATSANELPLSMIHFVSAPFCCSTKHKDCLHFLGVLTPDGSAKRAFKRLQTFGSCNYFEGCTRETPGSLVQIGVAFVAFLHVPNVLKNKLIELCAWAEMRPQLVQHFVLEKRLVFPV